MTPTSKDIKLKQKNTENYSVILMGAVESNRVSTDKRGVGVNSVVQTSDLASCIKKVQSPIAISNSKFSARGQIPVKKQKLKTFGDKMFERKDGKQSTVTSVNGDIENQSA